MKGSGGERGPEGEKSGELAPRFWKSNSTQPGEMFLPSELGYFGFPLWLCCYVVTKELTEDWAVRE